MKLSGGIVRCRSGDAKQGVVLVKQSSVLRRHNCARKEEK